MKSFFAYTLLIIGIPMFAGVLIGGIFQMPILWLLPDKTRIDLISLGCLDIVNGVITSLAAIFLFWLFGLTPGFAVPIIMSVWITFYFFAYQQSKIAWISCLIGIFLSWPILGKVILTA